MKTTNKQKLTQVELQLNREGGLDLKNRYHNGSITTLPTGNRTQSLQYWKSIQKLAENAIARLDDKAIVVHVVVVNGSGYADRKSYMNGQQHKHTKKKYSL